jgi:OOP family OmpA-OmpF porin
VALDDLVFASGSSSLTEGAYPSLASLAAWLKENPGLTIAVVGHTDASGGLEGNIALSRKRAQSVRERLIANYDVPAKRVEAEGVGYLSPRASNLTEEGRQMNRRVEVMMTSTQVSP